MSLEYSHFGAASKAQNANGGAENNPSSDGVPADEVIGKANEATNGVDQGPRPDGLTAERFAALFPGLNSAFGQYVIAPGSRGDGNGKVVGTAETIADRALTLTDYEAHLAGERCLGVCPLTENDTCLFIAININAYPIDPKEIQRACERSGLPLVWCRSKSGGLHGYAFFNEPVDARLAQERATAWATLIGYPDAQVFPTQDHMDETACEGWIVIPYYGEWSLRYAFGPDGKALTLDEFIDQGERVGVSGGQLEGWQPRETPPASTRQAVQAASACNVPPAITLTLFTDRKAKTKRQQNLTIAELIELIATTTAPSKEQLPLLKLAMFGDKRTAPPARSLRHDVNVGLISGIEVDYDDEACSVDAAVQRLREWEIEAIVYTSPSHTPDKPRWRVLCPFDGPRLPDIRSQMVDRLNGVLGGMLASESWTLSQSYYYGSVNGNPAHRVEHVAGSPINFIADLDQGAISCAGYGGSGGAGKVERGQGKRHSPAFWRALKGKIPKSGITDLGIKGREHALCVIAGSVLEAGRVKDRGTLLAVLKQYNKEHCTPLLKGHEVLRVSNSMARRHGL